MENAQLLYRDGEWTETADPFGTEGEDWDEVIKKAGYEHFFATGDVTSNGLAIRVFHSEANYMVEVDPFEGPVRYVFTASLPDLMELLAKWVPVVNGVTLSGLLASFEGGLVLEDLVKAATKRK
ncbi:hypothetical protein [Streptacidiphilus fuscans]|uniref:Uncharacterized protein n=1 Tax=Streptacidiphilus fuscans TaxID=2789292 RepID=A0A931B893_9ACTN|nr:hypothetical protein [Streptacidiphilus fuscans]MBF9070482.1 hypothetical protein [Streptacidiphilus fuscans]